MFEAAEGVLFLCILGSFLNGVFLNVRGVALDDLANLSHVNKTDLSPFFLASGVGGVLGALPTGALIDKLDNPLPVFAGGMFLRALSCAILPMLGKRSLGWLSVIGALQGFTLPLVGISLRTCVLWKYAVHPTPFLNLVMAAFGLGSVLSPIVYDAIDSNALGIFFYSLAGFCGVAMTLAMCLRGPSASEPSRGDSSTTALLSERVSLGESVNEEVAVPLPHSKLSRRGVWLFVGLNVVLGVGVGCEAVIGNFIYTLASARDAHKHGVTEATWLNSALWFTLTLVRLLIIPICKRFKESTILFVSNAAAIFALFIAAVYSMVHGSNAAYPSWVLWTVTIAFGAGIAGNFPCGLGFGKKILGRNYSGLMNAFIAMSANAGNGGMPAISNALSSATGLSTYIFTPLFGMLVMQIIMCLLTSRVASHARETKLTSPLAGEHSQVL